jgi:hypothetical protein
MVTQGQRAECAIDCDECGLEFEGTGTWDVEYHDGYGERRELWPDAETCPACKGDARCQGTFTRDESGKYVAVECSSDEGRTRTCIEPSGSLTVLGVYCDECQKFYEADE